MDTTGNLPHELHDKQNGLHYTLVGNYYLPNLTSREEVLTFGIWAQRRLSHLKEHKRILYINLLTQGELDTHLNLVDEQAEEMMGGLVQEMAIREGVDEELKRSDPMRWVGLMNNITHCAHEIVDDALIYA